MPRIDPTAAPIRVFSVARRIRSSKRIMQMAMTAATPAEIHASPATGLRTYPATTNIAVNMSRIITTSACITLEYYHANNHTVTKNLVRPAKLYGFQFQPLKEVPAPNKVSVPSLAFLWVVVALAANRHPPPQG